MVTLMAAWLTWFCVIFLMGHSYAVAPMTNIILAMLLPIISPVAMSGWLLTTARTQFANSGKDVPAATTTTPMANNDILSFFPKLTEPLTTDSAPPTSMAKPIVSIIKSTQANYHKCSVVTTAQSAEKQR